ncbi:hypothetical protein SteCoe_930 [Stentor coeruleus]|uniref:Ion transport domain-containing protein n=1 Tax=Stentor coeruleus TaxID=5963 RepID=A0A1R2D390_9CILI|nr:hypothetical protein SteCoe_930 [Stentor coeruleus]
MDMDLQQKLLNSASSQTRVISRDTTRSLETKDVESRALKRTLELIEDKKNLNLSSIFQREKIFKFHTKQVNAIAVSHDSKLLASAGKDLEIKIWDLEANEERISLKYHTQEVNWLAFSKDDVYLVSISNDSMLYVYEVASRQKVKAIRISYHGYCVCFSPSGNSIGVTSGNGKIYNFPQFTEEIQLLGHGSHIYCISFNHGGTLACTGGHDGTMKIWNAHNGKCVFNFTGHSDFVYSVSFSPDGQYVASASGDTTVKLINVEKKIEEFSFKAHSSWFVLSFSPNGKFLATGSYDKSAKLWSLETKCEILRLNKGENSTLALTFYGNGNYLATACGEGKVRLYDLHNTTDDSFTEYEDCYVSSVSTSNNGKYYAISKDYKINVLEIETNKCIGSIDIKLAKCVKFSIDDNMLACSNFKCIKIYKTTDFTEIASLQEHENDVYALDFSPDGNFLASGSCDGVIIIWNIKSFNLEHTFPGHKDFVDSVRFSPDSKRLASSGYDNIIKIWNILSKEEEIMFIGHKSWVTSICFSSNGKFLASSSKDCTVKIWNLEGQIEEKSFSLSSPINSMSLSADNNILVCGCGISIWTIVPIIEMFTSIGNKKQFNQNCIGSNKKNSLAILNLKENRLEKVFKDLNSPIISVEFTSNNKLIYFDEEKVHYLQMPTQANWYAGFLDKITYCASDTTNELIQPESLISQSNYSFIDYYSCLYLLSEKKYENISAEQMNFFISNCGFTPLHILAFKGEAIAIENILKGSEFVHLYSDRFGHSPIYYSIIKKHQKVTDIFLEYLIELTLNPDKKVYLPSFTGIANDIPWILKNSSKNVDMFFKVCMNSKDSIIIFGVPSSDLPMVKIAPDLSPMKNNFLTMENGEEFPLILKFSRFPIPSVCGSEKSIELLKAILESANKEIFKSEFIQSLVSNRWDEVKLWIYSYTFLMWINLVLLITLLADFSWVYLIPFIVVNTLLFMWEFFQFIDSGLEYIQDIWNLVDMLRLIFTGSWIIIKFTESNQTVLYYVSWFAVLLNVVRGVTGFRAFGATRYYIRLILQSLVSMKSFLYIFIYSTLSFGLLNIAATSGTISADSLWMDSFGLAFGETDAMKSEHVDLQYISFLIAMVVNVILMLNMIISILGDSFDEFQLMAEIYNYREMIEVLLEIEQLKSLILKPNESLYLHTCMHAYLSDEDSWQGKVMETKVYLQDVERKISEGIKSIDESIKTTQLGMASLENNIGKSVQDSNQKLSSRVENLENQMNEIKESLAVISERLEILVNKG